MKESCSKSVFVLCLIIGLFSNALSAQLGFCEGSSGMPIFTEDFGSGLTVGPELPSGTTSYTFTRGAPGDGQYTISSTTAFFDWVDTQDRTGGDTNGKSLIVNASFTAGEFYRRTVDGLCENTTYEFSSWLINLLPQNGCDGIGIPINVRFQIWDETDTNLLAQGDTGDIPNRNNPDWEQYALVFKTLAGQTSVILKMRNNANGGCGNDLAIDDISFRSCGDTITVADTQNETEVIACQSSGGINRTLTATPDGSIFTTYAYQWQESIDQILWNDVLGATNGTFTTPTISTTTYFRAKVAEDAINVSNDLCNVLSDVFEIIVVPIPLAPVSNGDISSCENEKIPLTVSVTSGVRVNWYNAPTGGVPLAEDSISYTPTTSGTYYAESISGSINCTSNSRTPLTYTINQIPQVTDESLEICDGNTIRLSADLDNVTYQWNTGETTKNILVVSAGTYTVMVTNLDGCSATKNISVTPVIVPIVNKIESDDSRILVNLANTGNFEFALDSGTFQASPAFESVPGGKYTINIRYGNNCGIVTIEYIHLVVPKFFTPNADGVNDIFTPQGIQFFSTYELSIYNRFGQLLKYGGQNAAFWDGTFNGALMPSGNYWYSLQVEDTIRKGYFVLKR